MTRGGRGEADDLDVINARNEQMLDALGAKTRQLLTVSRGVRDCLLDDQLELESLSISMHNGNDMMSKGRQFLHNVTDDPTYFGVFKIAMFVFWTLFLIYFPGKFVIRYVSRN
jgi:hypothetical protein